MIPPTIASAVAGDFDRPIDPWEGMRRVAAHQPPCADDFDPALDSFYDRIVAEQTALGR